MNQFVLAKDHSGRRINLVRGEFTRNAVGDLFDRDPVVHGRPMWKIVKVFTTEEQRRIAALELLIGHAELCLMFNIRM